MLISICSLGLFLYQNPDQADIEEQLGVEFVMLDVMVVDKKGRPITDLSLSDFVVKENRKKVDVSFFGSLDLRTREDLALAPVEKITAETETMAGPKADRQVQQIVVALDMESLDLAHVRRTFTQLRDFITTLNPAFEYQIYVHSLEYGAITKGFVTHRVEVLDALDKMQDQHFSHRTIGGRKARREGGLLEGMQPGNRGTYSSTSQGSHLRQGPLTLADLEKAYRSCAFLFDSDSVKIKNCMSGALQDFFQQHYDRTSRVLGELASLTKKFDNTDNLKTMILVSPGFTISRLDSALELQRAVMNETRDSYVGDQTNQFFNDESNQRHYRELLHACVRNRIIYHVLDIFNGMDENMRGGPQFATNNDHIRRVYQSYNIEISAGLQKLAGDTGGTFNQSFHLGVPVKKVIEGGRFFFQLGYTSPPGKSGKWRKIKVKCKRKGVKLSYRKGYYGT